MRVILSRAPHARDLPLPTYATRGAAGADLYAALAADVTLGPGERASVPTGVHLAIPDGYEGQVRPRSGLAARHGLGMVNAPGTIDSDFRGEVVVLLINWGPQPVTLRRGDRVAQLVIAPVARADWEDRGDDPLPTTPRGAGGFGHTGLRPLEEGEGADVSHHQP